MQTSRFRFVVGGCIAAAILLCIYLQTAHLNAYARLDKWDRGQPSAASTSLEDVRNSTLGFERIYVLNMPERSDKRDGMVLQAAVSDIELTFMDGVHLNALSKKILPMNHVSNYNETWVAAWRAHMNAISEIVRLNLTSALIMEDDIDWDIDLKSILQDIATSTTTISRVDANTTIPPAINFSHIPSTLPSHLSPYGPTWEVLWLGHCGTKISTTDPHILKHHDRTVPQPHHLHSWNPSELTPLASYPNHTRLIGHLSEGVCSLAYAVSQAGARKILYEMGSQWLDMGYDLMLCAFCSGILGRKEHECYGVLPPVFEHYRKAGDTAGDSDLHVLGEGRREKGFTMNIRRSVALNLERILEGREVLDQFPDV